MADNLSNEIQKQTAARAARFAADLQGLPAVTKAAVDELTAAYTADVARIEKQVSATFNPLAEMSDRELFSRGREADRAAGYIPGLADHLQPESYRNRGR